MKKPPKKEELPFVLEGENATIARNAAMIIKTPDQDKLFLEAMRSRLDSETLNPGSVDMLIAIIADKVLKLGVIEGSRLPLAIAGVVARTIRQIHESGYEKTLAYLYERLHHEKSSPGQMVLGLRLGDKGLRTASGFGDDRMTILSDESARTNAGRMALTGYHTALGIAEKSNGGASATAVIESVPPLIDHYHDVVEIMTEMRKEIIPQQIF